MRKKKICSQKQVTALAHFTEKRVTGVGEPGAPVALRYYCTYKTTLRSVFDYTMLLMSMFIHI